MFYLKSCNISLHNYEYQSRAQEVKRAHSWEIMLTSGWERQRLMRANLDQSAFGFSNYLDSIMQKSLNPPPRSPSWRWNRSCYIYFFWLGGHLLYLRKNKFHGQILFKK